MRELGDAMTYMLSARELLDLALPRMKRLAADFFEGKDRAFIGSGLSANRNVWSAASSQAKNESDRMVCANVFGLRWSTKHPGLDGMRCALVLFS